MRVKGKQAPSKPTRPSALKKTKQEPGPKPKGKVSKDGKILKGRVDDKDKGKKKSGQQSLQAAVHENLRRAAAAAKQNAENARALKQKEEKRAIKKKALKEATAAEKVAQRAAVKEKEGKSKEKVVQSDAKQGQKRKDDKVSYVPCKKSKIQQIFKTKKPGSEASTSDEPVKKMLKQLKPSPKEDDEVEQEEDVEEEVDEQGEQSEDQEDEAAEESEVSSSEDVEEGEQENEEQDAEAEEDSEAEAEEEASAEENEEGAEDEPEDGEGESTDSFDIEEMEDEVPGKEAVAKGGTSKDKEPAEGEEEQPLVKTVRNSVTHKREWDKFVRSKERFKVYGFYQSNKLDLFSIWLDSGMSWDKASLEVQRQHKSINEAKKGWEAKKGKDIMAQYGETKGKQVIASRMQQSLFYGDEDFPTDEMERWYWMPVGQKMSNKEKVEETMTLSASKKLDNGLFKALTADEGGVMKAGAMPSVSTATPNANKQLMDAMGKARESFRNQIFLS